MAQRGSDEQRGYRVVGRVQGVGFRWWTAREAEKLGVVGTVDNRPDGSVEVMARGSVAELADLEQALERGPPLSRVERIESIEFRLSPDAESFRILR